MRIECWYNEFFPRFGIRNGRAGMRLIYMGFWIGIKKRVPFGFRIR